MKGWDNLSKEDDYSYKYGGKAFYNTFTLDPKYFHATPFFLKKKRNVWRSVFFNFCVSFTVYNF